MVGFLPLEGCPSNKKVSESESSTGSGVTAATTDDGEIYMQGKDSQGQQDRLKLYSIVAGSTVDTSSGQFSNISDSLDRSPGEVRQEDYDPFRFEQSPVVLDGNLDFDQLDAGDLFPDDSEDNAPYDSGAVDARPLLPQQDLDSDAENESNEQSYDLVAQTKGMDIRKPSAHANASDVFSITPISSTTSIAGGGMETPSNAASFVDGSARPVLYSAICSLEQASANSFGRIRFQHKASSSRAFDREPALMIPPERKVSALHVATTVKPKRSVKIAEDTPTELVGRSEEYSKHRVKTDNTQDEKKDGFEKVHDSYEKLADIQLTGSSGTLANDSSAAEGSRKKRTNLPRRRLKKVTIKESAKPKEIFRPSSDAYTPRVAKKHFKFKPAEMRAPVQSSDQNMGTLSRPNFRDALKRVAMIIKQHIVKIEERFDGRRGRASSDGLFRASMLEAFAEDNFATPLYRCTMVRLPMAHPGMVYGLRKVQTNHTIPSEEEIYEFGHQLFKSVQLSSECSIVCLIYIERLMEVAKVPLVSRTWRTIFMCGLLLASKVWQDLSSWNIEFASVYPQFSLEAINRLEVQFLKMIKWDLYISSSLYAKYYFALRSILEKQDFRVRYNRMVGGVGSVDASEALKIQKRSEMAKEEALMQISRSM
jgi:hypothetical protein